MANPPALRALPEHLRSYEVIASVSGGKDSTALLLALREAGIPHRAVFADTGWEHPAVYEHLDVLRQALGIAIDVVGTPGGMRGRIEHRFGFPGRKQRWCTRELKLEPLRAYHDRVAAETNTDTVNAVGIRAEESAERAKMGELTDDDEWKGWIWRPLLTWSVEDVLRLHLRHGIPVNELYRKGFSRVGCFPCVYAKKEEVKILADNFPERIDELRALEEQVTAARAAANVERPGRFSQETATYFSKGIDEVVAWSRTSRGGVQLRLIEEPPTGGCMKWGLCDVPAASSSES